MPIHKVNYLKSKQPTSSYQFDYYDSIGNTNKNKLPCNMIEKGFILIFRLQNIKYKLILYIGRWVT